MTFTADQMLSDFGTVLPLQRGRKDALALYARRAASAANARSAQRWCEDTWGLKDYEAKDLLKGNASEAVWERIVKHKNGGWRVLLPIMGSVIGHGLDAYIAEEHRRIAREREQYEARERRLAAMAGDMRSLLSVVVGSSGEPDLRDDRQFGPEPRRVGERQDDGSEELDARSFAPKGRGRT